MVLDVDLADMNVGDVKTVRWLGRNVMVIRRDATALSNLAYDAAALQDPDSSAPQQPPFARNEYRARKPDHLVVFSNCTHLGCEVALNDTNGFSGFRCPCHRSEFDASGRVEAGSAARLNLEVPNYQYVARDTIRLIRIEGAEDEHSTVEGRNQSENV